MPTWHAARTRNAERILDCAERLPGLRVPRPGPEFEHAWYKCYVSTEPDQLRPGWDRDRIMNTITSRGVPCYSGICPEVYLEKAFADLGLQPPERLPVAKELGETSLMFLVHPTLTEAEIDKTCAVLEDVMMEAAGS